MTTTRNHPDDALPPEIKAAVRELDRLCLQGLADDDPTFLAALYRVEELILPLPPDRAEAVRRYAAGLEASDPATN